MCTQLQVTTDLIRSLTSSVISGIKLIGISAFKLSFFEIVITFHNNYCENHNNKNKKRGN